MHSPALRAFVDVRRAAGFALGLALTSCLSVACSSNNTSSADGCVPTTSIVATGSVSIDRGTAAAPSATTYTLTSEQAADLFNEGLLTVMAGDAKGGPGALDPKDPVALVKMDPSTDEPGSYGLDAVHAQVAYCPSAAAKIIVTNGALSGCSPSGTPVTVALKGTLDVMSSTDKTIGTFTPPSGPGPVSLTAQYGTQAQACN